MANTKASVVSIFPPGFFLENIASYADGGLLVSVMNRSQLYYIPPVKDDQPPATPMLIDTFPSDQWVFGIVNAPQNPNVVYIVTSDFCGVKTKEAHLRVLDTSNPAVGSHSYSIMTFPPETTGLNGFCALSDSVLVAADSFGSCIWRIDLDLSSFPPKSATAKKWLTHETMAGELVLPDFQPGVNGLKYSAKTGHVYYTCTSLKLICRVGVNQNTLEAEGEPQIISRGMQGDDLIVDDQAEGGPVAYLTTHRDNTILRVPLDKEAEISLSELEVMAEGSDANTMLLGPTAGVWDPRAKGRIAYFTTDGGLKNTPSDGLVRCPHVVRMVFK